MQTFFAPISIAIFKMAPTSSESGRDGSELSRRSKRTVSRKAGATSALDKIRKFRETGERSKYEVGMVQDVYQVVNEDEYSDIVRKRQEEDWVIDDDGTGYVDDGREIFDDDLEEPADEKNAPKFKPKKPNVKKPALKPKTINKMLLAASAKAKKPKKEVLSLGEDDILSGLLKEAELPRPAPVKMSKGKGHILRTPTSYSSSIHTPRRLQDLSVVRQPIIKEEPKSPTTPTNHTKIFRVAKQKVTVKTELCDQMAAQYGGVPGEKMKIEDSDNILENMDTRFDDIPDDDMPEYNPGDDDFGGGDDNDDDDLGGADAIQALSKAEKVLDEKVKREVEDAKKPSYRNCAFPQKMTELPDNSGWETVLGSEDSQKQEVLPDVNVDSSSLPLQDIIGEKVLKFYWFDAYEDRLKQPGTVYLFGKVWIESAKAFVSCSVAVKNIERQIFILPRDKKREVDGSETDKPVEFIDVYQEFNDKIATKHRIMKFISRKVQKAYAFEIQDVPVMSDYLEVRYSAEYAQLPSDLSGETFSHVFGTNTSSLELLLLNRKMKGPCWLNIKMPQLPQQPVSWCKVEAVATKPDHLEVAMQQDAPPPMVVMSLSFRTMLNTKNHTHEILAVSALIHHEVSLDKAAPKQNFQYHFCGVSKPNDQMYPYDFKDLVRKKQTKIEITTSERALLGLFMAKIHRIDPDVLVGHDIYGFDLDLLLHRINACKIPHWSRLGRLKRAIMPKLSNGYANKGGSLLDRSITCGRMVCDVKISSKELIRCKSYDLTALSWSVLQSRREEIDQDEIPNKFNSSHELLHMFELTSMDALLSLKIMYELNVLPLALQITTIAGNIMARTLLGGRSERNEFLLLHAFNEKNFICPDKSFGKKQVAENFENDEDDKPKSSKKGRRKPAYAGGLVLDPKKGFYDKHILLLDFNSLYPSIIQEYNICFTTISRASIPANRTGEDEVVELPDPDLEPGILPTEIRKLVERRKQVKGMMKNHNRDSDQYLQYDIRQKALKLTANSMYGCLGFSHSRFYAKPLAALVTSKGREILMKTKELVQNLGLDVIYGDTDSIMINTNSNDLAEVRKMGNKVKSEVNKLYRLLEIDIDGIFKSMLLLKKKKYAAISISENEDGTLNEVKEMKGLDIVRRDWSDLAKDAGNYVLAQILSSQARESIVENIHDYLTSVGENVAEGKVDLQKFIINKQLTKSPLDYPDKKSLPHVNVALRMLSKGRKVNAGDTIPYVICDDGSTLAATQRSYHPDEFCKSETLKIDVKYYLANQVHPVVSRLCDPIDGTDAAHIAQCLGLDPSGYRGNSAARNDETDAMLGGQAQMTDEERFKDCERFRVKCKGPDCGQEATLESTPFSVNDICPNCKIQYSTGTVCNQLTVTMRRHIKEYYMGWQKCDDPSCGYLTRQVPLTRHRGAATCPACCRAQLHAVYSDTALYTQLLYFSRLFDWDIALKNSKNDKKSQFDERRMKPFYSAVHSTVAKFLDANGYSEVSLTKLFSDFAF
ncbi:DNA polymerase alpha catalytic subunit-like isoform X2 [Acropora millepora]|uniref:DNA polymerase alpha catalytic subunit-like isoform X2 n=1 Tax=Acropora millepora TaxID=45264 RepID=UPI001CF205AB|nr:DNA polymerase alpha catalytic subunit-like isoform X2 [Acropora millepora]